MLVTILILIMTDVITDWFISACMVFIPLASSTLLGSRVSEKLKFRPMTTKEYLAECNPFRKGFSLMKLIAIYFCDLWFIMIIIACIIERVLFFISKIAQRRKRG